MTGKVFTLAELRGNALRLLILLGLDGLLFGLAMAPVMLGYTKSEPVYIGCAALAVTAFLIAFVLSLLLAMTLVALALLAWARRGLDG
jgi:hypothetical protein